MIRLTEENQSYGDMGLEGLIRLVETLEALGSTAYDFDDLYENWWKAEKAIENTQKEYAKCF